MDVQDQALREGGGDVQHSAGGGEAAAFLISCVQTERETEKERGGKKRPWLTHSLTSYLHIHSCLSPHFFSVTGSQIGWPLLT